MSARTGEPAPRSVRVGTVDITPDWACMRQWVCAVALTDPAHALEMARALGDEAPSALELLTALAGER